MNDEQLNANMQKMEKLGFYNLNAKIGVGVGLGGTVVGVFVPGMIALLIGVTIFYISYAAFIITVNKGRELRRQFEKELFKREKQEYIYTGPNGAHGLKHGNRYDIVVMTGELANRTWFLKDEYKDEAIAIVMPFVLSYKSLHAFNYNWEKSNATTETKES